MDVDGQPSRHLTGRGGYPQIIQKLNHLNLKIDNYGFGEPSFFRTTHTYVEANNIGGTVPVSPRWPACSSTSRLPWSFQTSPGRQSDKIEFGKLWVKHGYPGTYVLPYCLKHVTMSKWQQMESLVRMVTNLKRVAASQNKTFTSITKHHSWCLEPGWLPTTCEWQGQVTASSPVVVSPICWLSFLVTWSWTKYVQYI